jgi:hypothetical protein
MVYLSKYPAPAGEQPPRVKKETPRALAALMLIIYWSMLLLSNTKSDFCSDSIRLGVSFWSLK